MNTGATGGMKRYGRTFCPVFSNLRSAMPDDTNRQILNGSVGTPMGAQRNNRPRLREVNAEYGGNGDANRNRQSQGARSSTTHSLSAVESESTSGAGIGTVGQKAFFPEIPCRGGDQLFRLLLIGIHANSNVAFVVGVADAMQ